MGGAFSQLFMGRILFPIFRDYYEGSAEQAWRTSCIIPDSVAFVWGCFMPFIADDAPMGNYADMKKVQYFRPAPVDFCAVSILLHVLLPRSFPFQNGVMDQVHFTTSLRSGATLNTWILYAQYACSFCVELIVSF